MNGKRLADIMVCSIAAAVMVLSYLYINRETVRLAVFLASGAVFLLFLVMAFADGQHTGLPRRRNRRRQLSQGNIHTLALLDEEDRIVSEWNIGGKVSVLIGRDSPKEDVDINLSNTAFSGMVDRQHAVLNYTAGQWYIEDLDSANGIRIQKKDGRLYEVSKTQPCLVEREDILYIGLTKLQAR